MSDHLARLVPRSGKAEAGNHTVQPAFQVDQQGFARNTFLLCGLEEGIRKLFLQDPVDPPDLLLLTELDAVADDLGPAIPAVLSGREVALFDRAGILEASIALEEEFHPFPPAKPAFRVTISCQFVSPL